MSITKKSLLNISFIVVIIGVALMIAGFSLGGRFLDFGVGETTTMTDDYEDVQSIDITIDAGTLLIKEGEKYAVTAENIYLSSFESKLDKGVLKISNKLKKRGVLFGNIHIGFLPWINPRSVITLYMPSDAYLKNCSLTLGAGKIESSIINVETLHIKVGAGEVKISDLKATDTNLDCGVGNIEITGAISGDSQVKCGVGQIRMTLVGDKDDYDYRIKVGLGSTTINNDTYSSTTDKTIHNQDASGNFNLECGIGAILIQITE